MLLRRLLPSVVGLVVLSMASHSFAAHKPASTDSAAVSASSTASAQLESPVVQLRKTVDELQSKISSQHASLAQSPDKLYQVVQKVLMPIISIDHMAAMTLGPKWRTATEAQKKAFVKEFGQLLTRTYARSLLQVSNYVIKIMPLRGDAWKTAQQVAVRGALSAKGSEKSSPVTYYMERDGNDWKIYDFAVEGVSFVKNFQAQFQSYPNLKVLLKKLTELNAKQAQAS